jgi:hypothetical protein
MVTENATEIIPTTALPSSWVNGVHRFVITVRVIPDKVAWRRWLRESCMEGGDGVGESTGRSARSDAGESKGGDKACQMRVLCRLSRNPRS